MSRPTTTQRLHHSILALLLAVLLAATLLTTGCAHGPKYEASGQTDDEFNRGAGRSPTPKTLYATARLMAAQNAGHQSEEMLRKVVRADPKFLPAYCDLAELQMREDRPERAAQTLTAGLKAVPGDPVLLNNLGMCLLLKPDYGRARDCFQKAVEAQPRNAAFQANLALALGLLGREQEAEQLYRRILPPADVQHNLKVIREARESGPSPAGESKAQERK